MTHHRTATVSIPQRPGDPGLFLALAPMDGVTDAVYRDVLTRLWGHSGISLCASEFVRVTDHRVPNAVIRRHCPEVDHGGRTASGVPVILQLLGGRPEPMAATAAAAMTLGAHGIDLNFGCPAKRVNNHDGGASLLREPQRLQRITAAVRRAVPAPVPLSVKIRIGWEDGDQVTTLARAAEDGGADWLTIHARTRAQGYRPPVDWDAVGRASQAIQIPVIGNGDVVDCASARGLMARGHCGGLMIGRGAMGRPHLFRAIRGWDPDGVDLALMRRALEAYAQALDAAGYDPARSINRIKQWLRLAAPADAMLRAWFDAAKRAPTVASILGEAPRPTPDLRPAPCPAPGL